MAMELVQAPAWYLHLAGLSLLIGRILHALGLGDGHLKRRQFGIVITQVSILLSSIGVLVWNFLGPME